MAWPFQGSPVSSGNIPERRIEVKRYEPKKKDHSTKTMNRFFSSWKFSLSFWRKGKGLFDNEASVIKRRIPSSLATSATPRCPRSTLGMVLRV